jgi:putative membrane protein
LSAYLRDSASGFPQLLSSAVHYLQPYIFSPLIALSFGAVLLVYLRGLRVARQAGERVGAARPIGFFIGLGLCYAVMHTRFDYYAQYVFFMHRLQHLVLHHVGPFLIALAVPWRILARGLPAALRERCAWLLTSAVVRQAYRLLQHPVVAPVLFVGLIYFWLIPAVHFDAMLSLERYHLMNWSMLLDGLLFWWLMLDPGEPGRGSTLGYLQRALILFLVMIPQILLGAHITLSDADLYDVYSVCGRAWPIAAHTDQQLGGLITWIPPAMMCVIGVILVLRSMFRNEARREAGVTPVSSS